MKLKDQCWIKILEISKMKYQIANLYGCTHIKEENCGVKNAVQNGKIYQERYDRFCKIYEELKDNEKHRW